MEHDVLDGSVLAGVLDDAGFRQSGKVMVMKGNVHLPDHLRGDGVRWCALLAGRDSPGQILLRYGRINRTQLVEENESALVAQSVDPFGGDVFGEIGDDAVELEP